MLSAYSPSSFWLQATGEKLDQGVGVEKHSDVPFMATFQLVGELLSSLFYSGSVDLYRPDWI